jgi:hypothetical protein
VTDEEGRRNQSRLRLVGGGRDHAPSREVQQESVTLIPTRRSTRAGDTAEVLVLAPFTPAEGVLYAAPLGILRTERFRMSGSSTPCGARSKTAGRRTCTSRWTWWAPRRGRRTRLCPIPALPARPAYAMGTCEPGDSAASSGRWLLVTPRDTALEPGGSTVLDVALSDAAGKPVAGGEVAVVVVDEAVLSLTGYRLPDPLAVFYADGPSAIARRRP